ncbi:MAG: TonB-dependent receptor [Verrucomicrobia bacterium]|nr:TonB-dependent receptor [Verrucomicrobiota bacterium]
MHSIRILLAGVLASSQVRAAEVPAALEAPRQLEQVTVTSDRYHPVPPPDVPWFLLGMPRFGGGFNVPWGWPGQLEPVVVTAARTPQRAENVATVVRVLDAKELGRTPAATLDGVLRGLPAFSLFRRSDSLAANPTAQGVYLRGLGPSGASRSLVLYDGVPLNDPFGGWVAWSKLPREGLFRVEVVPGGGATAWGNAALGGAIQMLAAPVTAMLTMIDQPPRPVAWGYRGTVRATAVYGSFGTRSAEVALTTPAGTELVQFLARAFATNGYSLVAPEDRGPIDVPAWSRHRWLQGRWRHSVDEKREMLVTVRGFEESRGNGTPYTRNGTRERFLSAQLLARPTAEANWKAIVFAQDQSFASTFSSVNAARTAETPASDQYAVPAVALGAAWTGSWRKDAETRTSGGLDLRTVRGETRELYSPVAGRFSRRRVAGGRQDFIGGHVLQERQLAKTVQAIAGLRLDAWRDGDGHRDETDRDTGLAFRSDRYATQTGLEASPSAGLIWWPVKEWRWRANVQQAFRRPTLNELYRPFRQAANVTEANAALRTERVTSGETGLEWTRWVTRQVEVPSMTAKPQFKSQSVAGLTLAATAFWNDLRDAVGNVTIARGPGTFPIVGALPAGGLGRQRLNLDRTRVRGVELSGTWSPVTALRLTGEVLFNDAHVRRSGVAPALAGRQVAQVPRRSAAAGLTWTAPGNWVVSARMRALGRQFEDDENQLRLGAAIVADLGIDRPLTKRVSLFVSGENLADARVETGRSADGVVNLGSPRLILAGVRGQW